MRSIGALLRGRIGIPVSRRRRRSAFAHEHLALPRRRDLQRRGQVGRAKDGIAALVRLRTPARACST